MNKVKVASIDPNDEDLPIEENLTEVDMDVQSFDECITGIEAPEEVTDKLIKYLEKIIRKSYEYRQYINYLKDELNIKSCVLMPNLNIDDLNISLEFHHYPMTLYDITSTVINRQLTERKNDTDKISMFDVMNEVMEEHYKGHIGLVPLTKTMHEMAHSGAVKIPIDSVYGNYLNFFNKYRKFMTPDLIDKITNSQLNTRDSCIEQNKEKLETNVLHYNIKYNNKKDNEENDE